VEIAMNFLQLAAKFLGWLTGVLAGIGAVFYACGYIITQTRFHLLGINVLLPANRSYYLQEGANFFIVTGKDVGLLALGLAILALLVCIPVSILIKSGKHKTLSTLFQKCTGPTPVDLPWAWQAAGVLVALALLFYPLMYNLDIFRAPLELSGLLNSTIADAGGSGIPGEEARLIFTSLCNQNTSHLNQLYLILLMHGLFCGFLVWASGKLTAGWPFKTLLKFPFVVVFAIYLLLLLQDYAVLKKRIAFPEVNLVPKVDAAGGTSSETIYLLTKTDQEFILWNRATRQILWVPVAQVSKLGIGPVHPLLDKIKTGTGGSAQ
jgi:hypothetical protein